MTKKMIPKPSNPGHDPCLYRPNVGLAIFNRDGRVFWAQRLGEDGPYAWQMPQGGIDKGETPKKAALRELEEETGILPSMVSSLGRLEDWLYYDFPPEVLKKKKDRHWCGQKQKWFAFAFHGRDDDISIHTKHAEFSAWTWCALDAIPDRVIPWKQPVYREVVHRFSVFTHRQDLLPLV